MALPMGAPFDIYKACCVQTWWRGHFAYITQKARARETYISAILPPSGMVCINVWNIKCITFTSRFKCISVSQLDLPLLPLRAIAISRRMLFLPSKSWLKKNNDCQPNIK